MLSQEKWVFRCAVAPLREKPYLSAHDLFFTQRRNGAVEITKA
jgi:hypothetical protein